jgi:hypothetical protein
MKKEMAARYYLSNKNNQRPFMIYDPALNTN